MKSLGWRDKLSLLRCLRAVRRERARDDLDSMSFSKWLGEKRATPRSVARFWRPFIVSALNEEPDRSSALHALHVFADSLLGDRADYELGVPSVNLDELYSPALAGKLGPSVQVVLNSKVKRIDPSSREAEYYVSAVPFDRVARLVPDLGLDSVLSQFEHSPIAGIHLWFDRPITALPHAMLLDSEIQWIFRRADRYYLVVVSAARGLQARSSADIVRQALNELREFFPSARPARLLNARVIREPRATYSARPGLNRLRPGPRTCHANVFLAGDWTATGWPATMEGAVRSGYSAAKAILAASGAVSA